MQEMSFAAFGLIVGSFLNVCIARIPADESIVWPGSRCPRCRRPIAWYDNIPLLSYVLLRGRCRGCAQPISLRYPLIEAATGVLFLFHYKLNGMTPETAVYLVFSLALLTQAAIDWDHRIIPDVITLPGILAGLAASALWPTVQHELSWKQSLVQSGLGVFVGGGFLYAVGYFAERILKREAMGGGDVKLLAMIGAFTGPLGVLWTVFFASLFGSIVGIYLRFRQGAREIPFGPFLGLAAFLYLWVGPEWIRVYLDFLTSGVH